MPYGTVKVDNVTFTNNSVDATTTFSGIYASITNNLTLSGTATAATFTGTTANFTNVNAQNISVTTSLSGLAITGGTAGFTTITGTTVTGTTANFATVSGTTVTGTTARFITITGGTAGFTTITGTTVTGTTANFATVSGTTVTGTTASFTSGIFTSLSGTTHTITSGVFASGTAALPSISFVSDPNTGIYSPGADQVAVATNGVERVEFGTAEVVFNDGGENYDFRVESDLESQLFFIDASDNSIGVGTAGNYGDGAILVAALDRATGAGTTNVRLGIGVKELTSGQGRGLWLGARTDENTGVIGTRTASGNLAFETYNGSWGERMRLTYDGKLGIGTSAPVATLDVGGSTATTNGGLSNVNFYAGFAGSAFGGVLAGAGVTGNTPFIAASRTGAGTGLPLTFHTNGSERSRITSEGNVGIGTASPSGKLSVSNSGACGIEFTPYSTYNEILSYNRSTSAYVPLTSFASTHIWNDATGERARIDSSGRLLVGTIASPAHQLQVSTDSAGKPSTNTWTIVSDERIKEEIELADLDLCYQAVKTIPLKRFKWKDEVYTEEQVRDRRKLGWIAQDVEAVFPKAVGTYEFKYNQVFEETIIPAVEEVLDDEGNVTTPAQPERIEKGELISEDVIEDCRDLNSDQLYAAMYGAIQKLMIKVETLETELAALKAS